MQRRQLLAGLFGLGSGFGFEPSPAAIVRLAFEPGNPPFSMLGPQGQPVGFDIDLGRALCARIGVRGVWVAREFHALLRDLAAGVVDAAVAGITVTPQRAERLAFTAPYYTDRLVFVASRQSGFAPGAAAARACIGCQHGTTAEAWLTHTHHGPLRRYARHDQMLAELGAGRLDAVLTDQYAAYAWLRSPEGGEFAFVGEPLVEQPVAVALRPGDDALRARFDTALRVLRADGRLARLGARYFPFELR